MAPVARGHAWRPDIRADAPFGWKPAEGIAYNAGYTTGGLLVGFGLFAAVAALRNRMVGANG